MNAKKWVLSLPVIALILAALLAGFNYVTDPFGAFGDRFMQWFSYDETNNPRAAKISYLEQHQCFRCNAHLGGDFRDGHSSTLSYVFANTSGLQG